MKSPNYGDDPQHYKILIAKINEEADFPMHLHQNGYKLAKKSAGSMEFKKDEDRIVLQTARRPITYFNRNDSLDKGHFFKFIMRRSPNFYKAVQSGLEIVDRSYVLQNMELKIERSKTSPKSLENNYNIVPLRNSDYLQVHRSISESTVNSNPFRGRIFNAYHNRDNGGKIANIAFPKYDLEGNPKNYILYNRPYRSKKDNKIKKFRLVLNRKDHYLFHSRPIKDPTKIVFAESGIDLLSYHELHGKPDNFYVSFGGNVYKEKLLFFGQLVEPYLKGGHMELASIMDNDSNGNGFDLKIFGSLINSYNPYIYLESSFRNGDVRVNIHYTDKAGDKLAHHKNILIEKLVSGPRETDLNSFPVKCTGFSDKIVVQFNGNVDLHTLGMERKGNGFKPLLQALNGLYLPFPTQIHKSNGKDWNDDLRASKKAKFRRMGSILPDAMAIGDKIELRTPNGPEGFTNVGIIKGISEKSIECDFGLDYTYAIPYSAIRAHFQRNISPSPERGKENQKTHPKNNNLQNIL
ncbi:hypothetical protein LCGC14_1569070 [marine sediment metagenome]|uniref:Toprim-like n=2 Tax=root TaxID=1 RepID=A0A831QJF9_9FLAO|nr:hypothetical protein [Pricia sp.]HEA19415.1 hypothetical protein [Pricia antarctica]